jgi:hypothetical protein
LARIAVTVLVLLTAVACRSTVSGTAVQEPGPAAPGPGALDPGSYRTTPLPPLGTAGSQQAGRLVEGRRMSGYVVGPWQVDAGLTHNGGVAVLTEHDQLGAVVYPFIGAGAALQPLLVAFSSDRHVPDPKEPTALRVAVLRFNAPSTAAAAAAGMASAAMAMPLDADTASPIPTEPIRAVPVPGHAGLTGALFTHREGDATVQELTVISAHGPYVLVQVAQAAQGPDRAAALAGRALDLQVPLIDGFVPTDPARFADLPLDPTGLVARTLPLKPGQGDSLSNAAYEPAGALHLEDNPVEAARAFADTGVDAMATSKTTIYRARDAAGARRLAQMLGDDATRRPAAQPAAAVAGLPQSRCVRLQELGGPLTRNWCIAAVDRFAFKAVARQLDDAQQQMAAQYRMLAG